jgi:hypothetical protein
MPTHTAQIMKSHLLFFSISTSFSPGQILAA